jgi:hypothetical protein
VWRPIQIFLLARVDGVWAGVLTLALGQVELLGPVAGVDVDLTSHDQAILIQLSNVLACTKFIIKFCD